MADIILTEGDNVLNISLAPIPPPVANLSGTVTDAETGSRLSGVKVTIDGLTDTTDYYGRYSFGDLEVGGYTIKFEKEGYETVTR